MDFSLPPAVDRWRDAATAFVAEVLTPAEGLLPPAEGDLPAEWRQRCAAARRQAGLWGLTVPAAESGPGLSWVEQAAIQERLQRSPLGLWPQGLFTAGEPPTPLYAAGAARTRFLEPCLQGRRQAHQVWADGSGPGGPRCTPTAGGARLQGTLQAVPALLAEDLAVVIAPCGGRTWAFLCEPGLPGYRVVRRRPGMGAMELVDLAWEDCDLPPERLLPDVAAAAGLWRAHERAVVLGAGALGAATHCLELGLGHLRRRQTFGRPLADRQAMQWMVADSARELHAARLLVYRVAAEADAGRAEEAMRLAGPAKAEAAATACRVVDRVIQMHGGSGYSRDLPLERFWRDLRFYRLAGGGEEALWAEALDGLLADLDG